MVLMRLRGVLRMAAHLVQGESWSCGCLPSFITAPLPRRPSSSWTFVTGLRRSESIGAQEGRDRDRVRAQQDPGPARLAPGSTDETQDRFAPGGR